MAVSQKLARREIFHPEKGQAAQCLSFTSIYDACKSAKGVCLNRDSMHAVFAGRFRDENKTARCKLVIERGLMAAHSALMPN